MDHSIDLKNINLIKKSLFELGLEDKFMDGFSTEKLLVQSNAEGSGGDCHPLRRPLRPQPHPLHLRLDQNPGPGHRHRVLIELRP